MKLLSNIPGFLSLLKSLKDVVTIRPIGLDESLSDVKKAVHAFPSSTFTAPRRWSS